MTTPLLGFITPAERTQQQHDAHAAALAQMPRFALAAPTPGPVNVRLFEKWSDPDVVADVGFVFPRFHQLTGSCVGAGGGQALFTLIAVQRCLSEGATKAFLPFWPFDYGRCRFNEGDRGQGEGAMGSSFAETVAKEGVIDATTAGLPAFQNDDGLVLTNKLEMQWSDGASSTVTKWLEAARVHPVGTSAEMRSMDDVDAALINGYPVTWACDNYIGHASVQGGSTPCVVGYWDGRGGHQQSVHAVWDHPSIGRLYWVQNNWPGDTYPTDPAGGPTCGCWVTRAKAESAMRSLNAEVYALSHLNWFPAQPKVLDWYKII
jgi:hypothetical protein